MTAIIFVRSSLKEKIFMEERNTIWKRKKKDKVE